jgi:long-chain acyl-CoA synthetase
VAIIYTSGTSGVPKGVMLSRANIDFMIPKTISRLNKTVPARGGPDEVFHFLPFCFAAARTMLWTQLSRPNPIMISTELTNLVQEIGTARPHYFLNVPAVLERIRNGVTAKVKEAGGIAWSLYSGGFQAYRRLEAGTGGFMDRVKLSIASWVVYSKVKNQIGPNLEFLISGSAPLSEDTQQWFRMLGIAVYQAYGLTETTGIVSLDEPDRVVPGRVGYPLDEVECKLGEGDELLVRGPNIFEGYWRMPEETAASMSDGWFRTGDQVEIEDGNIRIVGRIKNLIIPESGHNISPEPIEEKFMEYCPDAEQCMLVGHGKPSIGILVTGEPDSAAVDAAIERVNGEVPHYRRIRNFHLTDESFTVENGLLTANQKLRRRVIEAHLKVAIDALYSQAS